VRTGSRYFTKVEKEKKSERLELVHKYVWGPTQVSSLGGSHCYVTFIDDATRKKWVYFILLSHIIVWGVFSFGFGPWVKICEKRGLKTHQMKFILSFLPSRIALRGA
jgi:hypothetical protein